MARKTPPIATEKKWDVDVSGLTCHEFTKDDGKILSENKFEEPEKDYIKDEISYISDDHVTAFSKKCEVGVFDPLTHTNDRDEMMETVMKPSFIKSYMKDDDWITVSGFSFGGERFKELLDMVSSFDDFSPDKVSVFHGGRGANQMPARLTFIDSKKKEYIVAVHAPRDMDNDSGYDEAYRSAPCDPSTVGGFLSNFRDETKYQKNENNVNFAPIPANIFISEEFNKNTIKEMSPMEVFKTFREIATDLYYEGDDDFFDSTLEIDALANHPRFNELIGYVHSCGVIPKSKRCNNDLCLIKTGKEGDTINKAVLIAREPIGEKQTTERCSPWKEASRDDYSKKQIRDDIRLLSKLTATPQKDIKEDLSICRVEKLDGDSFNKFVAKPFIAYKGKLSILDDFVSSIPTKPNTLMDVVEFTYD